MPNDTITSVRDRQTGSHGGSIASGDRFGSLLGCTSGKGERFGGVKTGQYENSDPPCFTIEHRVTGPDNKQCIDTRIQSLMFKMKAWLLTETRKASMP